MKYRTHGGFAPNGFCATPLSSGVFCWTTSGRDRAPPLYISASGFAILVTLAPAVPFNPGCDTWTFSGKWDPS